MRGTPSCLQAHKHIHTYTRVNLHAYIVLPLPAVRVPLTAQLLPPRESSQPWTTPGRVLLPEGHAAVSCACGEGHSMVILGGGELYGWGDNSQGQVGHNT